MRKSSLRKYTTVDRFIIDMWFQSVEESLPKWITLHFPLIETDGVKSEPSCDAVRLDLVAFKTAAIKTKLAEAGRPRKGYSLEVDGKQMLLGVVLLWIRLGWEGASALWFSLDWEGSSLFTIGNWDAGVNATCSHNVFFFIEVFFPPGLLSYHIWPITLLLVLNSIWRNYRIPEHQHMAGKGLWLHSHSTPDSWVCRS